MRKLVPLKVILANAEEEGLDTDAIVCDPRQVHIVESDDLPEPEEEEPEEEDKAEGESAGEVAEGAEPPSQPAAEENEESSGQESPESEE